MEIRIHHVSVLVRDVREVAARLQPAGYAIGPCETFAAEGTEEIYIGSSEHEALLLLQAPIGPGPYSQAYHKRGPGLHHIALDVPDLLAFAHEMATIGWLLHPVSLQNYAHQRAVFFARPGVHVLLEVNENKAQAQPRFISHIHVPVAKGHEKYITDLQIPGLHVAEDGLFALRIQDHPWPAATFL